MLFLALADLLPSLQQGAALVSLSVKGTQAPQPSLQIALRSTKNTPETRYQPSVHKKH